MATEHTDLFKAHFADLYGFFKRYVAHNTSHLTLLDFGCGHTGYVSLYSEHFGRSLGLDVVDYAAKYDEGVEFVLSNGRDSSPTGSTLIPTVHTTSEWTALRCASIGAIGSTS
jgi:hypothetical protein